MKFKPLIRPLLLAALIATAGGARAQTTMPAPAMPMGETPTRMQVKMERDEFLKTHERDERSGQWRLKPGVEAPMGVKTRAEVMAARDEFLRSNRWDPARGAWVPMAGVQRAPSTTSRAQVRADTARFLSTHRWDEATSTWVEKAPRPSKG